MNKAIDQVSLAFGIENKPTVADIFTDIFMPGDKDRMLK
jgi:NitT/TauT family transport system substrate-binding protein